MLKGNKKKTLRIVALVSSLCFSLISFVASTFCWFYGIKNRETPFSGTNLYSSQDFSVSCRVLKFDDATKSGIEYKEEGTNKALFSMQSYDSMIKDRNTYLSQIIELKLTAKGDNPSKGDLKITIPRKGDFYDFDNDYVMSYMSNLLTFKALLYSHTTKSSSTETTTFTMGDINRYVKSINPKSTEVYKTTDDKIYQEVRAQFSSGSYTKYSYVDEEAVADLPEETDPSFISDLKDIHNNKEETIDLVISRQSGKDYVLPPSWATATLYLQYDYSETLADFFAERKHAKITSQTTVAGGGIFVGADFGDITLTRY